MCRGNGGRGVVFVAFICLLFLQQCQHTTSFQFHHVPITRRSAIYNTRMGSEKLSTVYQKQQSLTFREKSNKRRLSSLYMKATHIHVESQYESACTTNYDKDATLTRYMMLPVEHFVFVEMPMQSTLNKNEGEETFTLTTPPIRFFQLDVSPVILCKIFRQGDSVVIQSVKCLLKGGPTVDKLNGCFNIDVCTTLTWTDTDSKKTIQSRSKIDAVIDPPAPFKYLGATVLQKSGTMAMNLAVKQIENAFVGSLTKDYEQWATSNAFRHERDASVIKMKSEMINYDTDVDRPLVDELQTAGGKLLIGEGSKSTTFGTSGSKAALAKLELENASLKRKLRNAENELKNIQQALTKVTSSLR